jgi:hypothetical protein
MTGYFYQGTGRVALLSTWMPAQVGGNGAVLQAGEVVIPPSACAHSGLSCGSVDC